MTSSGLVRRFVGVGGLLAALLVALLAPLASPASAEPDYPPKFNKITASKFVVHRHGTVAFKAQYYKPGSTVRYKVVVRGHVVTRGTTTANAKGIVHKTITFDVVGKNWVTFSGTSSKGRPLALSAKITVIGRSYGGVSGSGAAGSDRGTTDAEASGTSGSAGGVVSLLPHTGAQVAGTLVVAALLVGGGAALIGVSRRRRHS